VHSSLAATPLAYGILFGADFGCSKLTEDMEQRLIDFRVHGYSQSGEQGIVSRIFEVLGANAGLCCEFGAWDGIHFSNTRALMENGWRGLMIEADKARFEDLKRTYPAGSKAICVCEFVDGETNSLARIAERNGIQTRFDFVNIDIDGLDYAMFESLAQFEHVPLVVCIEAHTCHIPEDEREVGPRPPGRDPGQPLGRYVKTAKEMGYRLVCFLGTNAFFVHVDAGHEDELPMLTPRAAAMQNFALTKASKFAREYMYRTNLGLEPPYYHFNNPLYSRSSLGIPFLRAIQLRYRNASASE
jgi:hypothetical protein